MKRWQQSNKMDQNRRRKRQFGRSLCVPGTVECNLKWNLKSGEDAQYQRSMNNEAEIKGNKTMIRNDKQHVSTGQFSYSSSAACVDEWEQIRQTTCTAVQCGGCLFLSLCERVHVCWYLSKHKEDLELLSASVTAVGGEKRFKPSPRWIPHCVRNHPVSCGALARVNAIFFYCGPNVSTFSAFVP